jgi:hypothetical protein
VAALRGRPDPLTTSPQRSEDSETSDRYDRGAGGCIEREASISVLLTAVGPPVTGDDRGRWRPRALDG